MDSQPDYTGFEEQPDDDKLSTLHSLVEQLVVADVEADELEEKLKVAKKKAQDLRENAIPQLMTSLGLKKIHTASGVEVDLKEDVRGSFFVKNPEKRAAAFAWLKERGHDGLIKNVVSVNFDREHEALAEKFLEFSKNFEAPLDIRQNKDIHNQTLMAFLREQLRESDEPVPLELFGAHAYTTVKTRTSKG